METISVIMMHPKHYTGEQLVLPEGKEQTILCRSPAEINYLITWVANGAPIDDDHLIFTVGEERQLTGGEKGDIHCNTRCQQYKSEMCCL